MMLGYSKEDATKFVLHSFRVGAVFMAVQSKELSDLQIQKAGRWKSVSTPLTYVVQFSDVVAKMIFINNFCFWFLKVLLFSQNYFFY